MSQKREKAKKDKLSQAMARVSSGRLGAELTKSEIVIMRVTHTDKVGMVQAAGRCRLTVTEYLTRLHHIALSKLRGK